MSLEAKARHFRDEAESALANFERATEWADLIRDLQRLQRILTKYAQLPLIPDTVGLAKRLHQCLNPALPSGVHLTTLQTYELIFSRIGPTQLARDLAFYSEGIFDLYRHASYQVRPALLDLFERHFVTLGGLVVPCLPGLVPALLAATEDVGSEFYQRAIKMLDELAADAPIADFMAAVWGALLRNGAVRLQALHYIAMRFPGDGEPSRLPCTPRDFCPDAEGAVLRSLIVALQQGDTLVRRTALDLIVAHFALPDPASTAAAGWQEPLFSDDGFARLLRAALELLPLREWALTRRVLLWIFRQAPALSSSAVALDLPDVVRPYFLAAARSIVEEGSGASPRNDHFVFRTLSHMLDVPAFAEAIATEDDFLLSTLTFRFMAGESAEAVRDADRFFFHERLPQRVLWRACTTALTTQRGLGDTCRKLAGSDSDATGSDVGESGEGSWSMLSIVEATAAMLSLHGAAEIMGVGCSGPMTTPRDTGTQRAPADGSQMLMGLLISTCESVLGTVRGADHQRTLAMLQLYHNLLHHLRAASHRAALEAAPVTAPQPKLTDARGRALSTSIPMEGLDLTIDDRTSSMSAAGGGAGMAAGCSRGGAPSGPARDRADTADEAALTVAQLEAAAFVEREATAKLDGAMSTLLPAYSRAFGDLVSSYAAAASATTKTPSQPLERTQILALRLANRLMLVHLRLTSPMDPIAWGMHGGSTSVSESALKLGMHDVGAAETTSLATATFAVSPFEISRAPASALSTPSVSWSPSDDDTFLRLVRAPTAGPSTMSAARNIAAECSDEQTTGTASNSVQSLDIGDSVIRSKASAAPPPATPRALRETPGEGRGYIYPLWLASLLEGCRAKSFAVVALCAPTLALAIDSGRGELSLTQAIMVLRTLWSFLGDADGSTQHAAAFIWIRMQMIWPDACAAVLAHELRAAQDTYTVAELSRQAAVAEGAAAIGSTAAAVRAARRASVLHGADDGLLTSVLAPGSPRLNSPDKADMDACVVAESDDGRTPEAKDVRRAAAALAAQLARFSLLWRAALLSPQQAQSSWSAGAAGGSGSTPPVSPAHSARPALDLQPSTPPGNSSPLKQRHASAMDDGAEPRSAVGADADVSVLPVAGVGLPLALELLSHPSAVVRTTAQRWVLQASCRPLPLLAPLLTLLVSKESPPRVCLFALGKLRTLLSVMHNGTIALLGELPAPLALLEQCRLSMEAAPLVPDVLPCEGGSLLLLLAAATLLQVVQPAGQRGARHHASEHETAVGLSGVLVDVIKEGEPSLSRAHADHADGARAHTKLSPVPLRFGDAAQVLATELMTALLHATPARIGRLLSASLLEPVLRILRASVGSGGRGAQEQLLVLAHAALSKAHTAEHPHPPLFTDLLVPTITSGLADARAPVWANWAGFCVSCLTLVSGPRDGAVVGRPADADGAAALATAMLTTLSELLLAEHATLPPQQLETLLVALHHTYHLCIFAVPPHALPLAESYPKRPVAPDNSPPYLAMQHSLPLVLWAVLTKWRTASPSDAHTRQLALSPLSLLSAHCPRELLAAAVGVWELHYMRHDASSPASGAGSEVGEASLLGMLSSLPDCSASQLLGTAAELAASGTTKGLAPARSPPLVLMRFVHLYVQRVQSVRALADAWPRLLAYIKAAVSTSPAAPSALLLVLWSWVGRMEQMPGDSSPLLRTRERHEAKDCAELLFKAALHQISRASRRLPVPFEPVEGPVPGTVLLEPHSLAWDDPDLGVTSLLGLEQTMTRLLAVLFPPKPNSRRDHGLDVLTVVLPAILAPLEAVVAGTNVKSRVERLAHAALLVLLRIVASPNFTRVWRKPVGRLFSAPGFFSGLSRRTLPLWARVVNAWLGLDTPKAAMETLLSGKMGIQSGFFSSRAAEAEAYADLLRRVSFALLVGERNQYAGALQGMLLERLVAAFKYGALPDSPASKRWLVQVAATQCARVLSVRVAPENLTTLWPIVMAELQRILLSPADAQPPLLLAACSLVDTLLAVLPDDFSSFGWMFVPCSGGKGAPPRAHSLFAALLTPLATPRAKDGVATPVAAAAPAAATDNEAPWPAGHGLLAPASDGRRRPLLGLLVLTDIAELAPFATTLHEHLKRAAVGARGGEIDMQTIDRLLGCIFLSPQEAQLEIAPLLVHREDQLHEEPPPRNELIGVRRIV